MGTKIAIYPGTFDPITNGHIDIIERARVLFDRVIVTIALNQEKQPLFTVEERKEMIRQSTEHIEGVEVDDFGGLLVHYAQGKGAIALIRGLRAVSDFEYEFQMALMNKKLAKNLLTVFLMPNEKYTYLDSTIVKEVAQLGGNISCFVPAFVVKKLKEKFQTGKGD